MTVGDELAKRSRDRVLARRDGRGEPVGAQPGDHVGSALTSDRGEQGGDIDIARPEGVASQAGIGKGLALGGLDALVDEVGADHQVGRKGEDHRGEEPDETEGNGGSSPQADRSTEAAHRHQ